MAAVALPSLFFSCGYLGSAKNRARGPCDLRIIRAELSRLAMWLHGRYAVPCLSGGEWGRFGRSEERSARCCYVPLLFRSFFLSF